MASSSRYNYSEYVDIFSDACMKAYPENSNSSFCNDLIEPQLLPEGAKVCLSEIEFVYALYNISSTAQTIQNSLTVFDFLHPWPPNSERNPNSYVTWGRFVAAEIVDGCYRTHQSICDMLNRGLQNCGVPQLRNKTVFTYDPITMKYSYDVEGLYLSIFVRGDLLLMLGCATHHLTLGNYMCFGKSKMKESYIFVKPDGSKETRMFDQPNFRYQVSEKLPKDTFPYVAQICLVTSIACYTNIIASQKAGENWVDCLRIINIPKLEPGESTVIQFDKPYYLDVKDRFLSSIKVELKSLAGHDIDIKVGRVRLKLRFIEQNQVPP